MHGIVFFLHYLACGASGAYFAGINPFLQRISAKSSVIFAYGRKRWSYGYIATLVGGSFHLLLVPNNSNSISPVFYSFSAF